MKISRKDVKEQNRKFYQDEMKFNILFFSLSFIGFIVNLIPPHKVPFWDGFFAGLGFMGSLVWAMEIKDTWDDLKELKE